MGSTILCLDFWKSLCPYQPPARMQLLTGEGPETNISYWGRSYWGTCGLTVSYLPLTSGVSPPSSILHVYCRYTFYWGRSYRGTCDLTVSYVHFFHYEVITFSKFKTFVPGMFPLPPFPQAFAPLFRCLPPFSQLTMTTCSFRYSVRNCIRRAQCFGLKECQFAFTERLASFPGPKRRSTCSQVRGLYQFSPMKVVLFSTILVLGLINA